MVIEVVDTNVWVNIDKIPPDSETERECILACLQWGSTFRQSDEDYKLAVDDAWKILSEYRRNIKSGGLAERYLNDLLSQPITRLTFVTIQFDEHGHAKLSTDLIHDPNDRKFVAVSLQFQPPAVIVNSTDTDWEEARNKLEQQGIPLRSLCPDYIQGKTKQS